MGLLLLYHFGIDGEETLRLHLDLSSNNFCYSKGQETLVRFLPPPKKKYPLGGSVEPLGPMWGRPSTELHLPPAFLCRSSDRRWGLRREAPSISVSSDLMSSRLRPSGNSFSRYKTKHVNIHMSLWGSTEGIVTIYTWRCCGIVGSFRRGSWPFLQLMDFSFES